MVGSVVSVEDSSEDDSSELSKMPSPGVVWRWKRSSMSRSLVAERICAASGPAGSSQSSDGSMSAASESGGKRMSKAQGAVMSLSLSSRLMTLLGPELALSGWACSIVGKRAFCHHQ